MSVVFTIFASWKWETDQQRKQNLKNLKPMRKIAHDEKDIQKRRATWPEQWTAYQSQGLTVEKIRETVFSTIDPDKELKGYIGKVKNALMGFENGVFSFSEEGLRASLKATNADLSQFQMQVDEEVKTEQTDRYVHDFLKFYYKRRDAYTQTCTITYKGIQMTKDVPLMRFLPPYQRRGCSPSKNI